MSEQLQTVEIETGRDPQMSIVWLHGLGADGHDFTPAVPEIAAGHPRPLRFVFPHAPVRPVSLNGGYPMRAWYDIVGLDRHAQQDEPGVRASERAVQALIRRENARGIPSERIVIAGFSQGGAMALHTGLRYPEKLAGIVGLSCYMVMATKLDAERHSANANTPVFMAHGEEDAVVSYSFGVETHGLLAERGYPVEWHSYPMEHSVSPAELAALAAWLKQR